MTWRHFIIVANINHAVRHTMIYGEINVETVEAMKELYKVSFFVMQGWYLLKYGDYIPKREILIQKAICVEDKLMLESYLHWNENSRQREENPTKTLALLERWSSEMFDRLKEVRVKL